MPKNNESSVADILRAIAKVDDKADFDKICDALVKRAKEKKWLEPRRHAMRLGARGPR